MCVLIDCICSFSALRFHLLHLHPTTSISTNLFLDTGPACLRYAVICLQSVCSWAWFNHIYYLTRFLLIGFCLQTLSQWICVNLNVSFYWRHLSKILCIMYAVICRMHSYRVDVFSFFHISILNMLLKILLTLTMKAALVSKYNLIYIY